MKCTTRGCKEEVKPSTYLETYGFCSACKTLVKIESRPEPKKPKEEPEQEIIEEPQAKKKTSKRSKKKEEYVYTDCSYHPKYAGKRKPRTDCSICWQVYKTMNTGK